MAEQKNDKSKSKRQHNEQKKGRERFRARRGPVNQRLRAFCREVSRSCRPDITRNLLRTIKYEDLTEQATDLDGKIITVHRNGIKLGVVYHT